MDGRTTAALIVTVSLAFIGYLVKYLNDIAVAKRRDRLDRVNLQLRNLYGPLYALDHATSIAFDLFNSRRPNVDVDPATTVGTSPPPTKEALDDWRLWMTEVFMPFNLRMEKAIIENADLIIENEMPPCLLQLVAHIAAYEPVVKKWQSNDYSEDLSMSIFPTDLREYAESSYVRLKHEQAGLIGKLMRLETIDFQVVQSNRRSL